MGFCKDENRGERCEGIEIDNPCIQDNIILTSIIGVNHLFISLSNCALIFHVPSTVVIPQPYGKYIFRAYKH